MKKFIKYIIMFVSIFSILGCSSVVNDAKKVFSASKNLEYNNIVATFVTNKGEISFYLYPEAAPLTVANFINLSKRGFYDNNKIFREVENFVLQTGDPTGTGKGTPGYSIKDEIVTWLDFYQQGMLAMANSGPDTNGSQFFFTLYPSDWLNGKHTIFGQVKSSKDFEKLRKLEYNDTIKEIKFSGTVDKFMSVYKPIITSWNNVLDKHYPNLKKYNIEDATQSDIEKYNEEIKNIYERNNLESDSYESPVTKAIRGIFNGIENYSPKEKIVNQQK